MISSYEKPSVIVNADMAECVYTASGDGGDCYSVTAYIHQRPEPGREDFRIQVDAEHSAGNGHHSGKQTLILSFNQPVTYVSSQGALAGGDGTAELSIDYDYHNNGNENIGLGDVVVTSNAGLSVTGVRLICNYDCGDSGHKW